MNSYKYSSPEKNIIIANESGVILYVPTDPGNSDYRRILQLVENESVVIEDYETPLSQKLTDVTRERDRRIDAGFVFNGVLYQSRASDRENITGAALMAFMAIANGVEKTSKRWHGGPDDFSWIAMDNSLVVMDAQTVVAFGMYAAGFKSTMISRARLIKDRLESGEQIDIYADTTWN